MGWKLISRDWRLDDGRRVMRSVFECTGCQRSETITSFTSTLPAPCECTRDPILAEVDRAVG